LFVPDAHHSLAEWIYYLENLHSVEIQLGLSRIQTVAEELQLLKPGCKLITVAGTNGKGSTVAALEAMYLQAGYQLGCYTSPHLLAFNERVRINGRSVADDDLCKALSFIEKGRKAIPLTYFEIITLAALWLFKQSTLDLIILEVGLGGRQDATNIIDADLAIITTIDFDHQQFLGYTLESIAYEKAGILRHGQTMVYADVDPPKPILDEAERLGVQVHCLGRDYHYKQTLDDWELQWGQMGLKHLPKPQIHLKAAASALVAAKLLDSFLPVNHQAILAALTGLTVAGRLHYIPGKISVLYDVAHNHQAVCLLAEFIKKIDNKHVKLHAVFSALKDKTLKDLIDPLKEHIDYWYPSVLNHSRAANAQMMKEAFDEQNITDCDFYSNPVRAFQAAQQQAIEGDLIIIYGSFITVAQVMEMQLRSKTATKKETI